MITYFEHYPHYMGTKNATVKIDPLMFLMAQQAVVAMRSREDDLLGDYAYESIIAGIEAENDVTLYAFADALTNAGYGADEAKKGAAKTVRALVSKGWFAGEWEEGSFYLALPGFEKEAQKALLKIEAQHLDIYFD